MINLNLTTATRWGLNLLALLGVVVALYLGKTVFIPTVISVLLAAMLWPAAAWLNERLRLPWSMACMAAVGSVVIMTLLVTLGFGLAIPKLLQDLPSDAARQQEVYAEFRKKLEDLGLPLDEQYFPPHAQDSQIVKYIGEALKPEKPYVVNILWQIADYSNAWIWQWVLVLFILIFLLLEGRMLTRRVVEIFGPSPEAQAKAVEALADMARHVRTYLVWRTIINFGLAVVVGLVYQWVFHLKQPWTWALLTAVLCYIPYLGPIAAGIPPLVDAFVSQSPSHAAGVLVFYVAVIVLEGYVIVPVVMGRSMELNATTVMLACLFWDLVWGTPGLFLAMPLMAALKAICWHMPGLRPWANLMGTREADLSSANPESLETTMLLDKLDLPVPAEVKVGLSAQSAGKEVS